MDIGFDYQLARLFSECAVHHKRLSSCTQRFWICRFFCCFVVYLQPSLSFRWKDNFTKFHHQLFFFNLNIIFVLIIFCIHFLHLRQSKMMSHYLVHFSSHLLFFRAFLHFCVCSFLWTEEAVQCAIKQHLRLKDTLYTERQRMRAGK